MVTETKAHAKHSLSIDVQVSGLDKFWPTRGATGDIPNARFDMLMPGNLADNACKTLELDWSYLSSAKTA